MLIKPSQIRRWEDQLAVMLAAAAGSDPAGFAAVVKIIDDARAELRTACLTLREHGNYSWSDLAGPLGVTKQAVHQRFGDRQKGHAS